MQWDVVTAVRAARKLGGLDVAWLEEPLDADDLPAFATTVAGRKPIA